MDTETKVVARSGFATRVMSFCALAAMASAIVWVGRESYQALTDSFVAPAILSPDSDIIIGSKLKLAELAGERAKTKMQLDAIDADVAAIREAVTRLRALEEKGKDSLAWTVSINARAASSGAMELDALAKQKAMLADIVARQRTFADEARANMTSGLVSKTDYAREVQALHQAEIALIEADRVRVQTEAVTQQARMASASLAGNMKSMPMPEMLLREDQNVRIELDILRLESDVRAKNTERRMLEDRLAKIDEIDAQLRGRPIYRAVDKNVEVAFVPYTQIDGLHEGDDVYDCIWSMFHCKKVGRVSELVPGEVILPDPWGNQARGQYAVLDLVDHQAARSKALRVRTAAPSVVRKAGIASRTAPKTDDGNKLSAVDGSKGTTWKP